MIGQTLASKLEHFAMLGADGDVQLLGTLQALVHQSARQAQAWVKLIGTWQTRSLLWRVKIGCAFTADVAMQIARPASRPSPGFAFTHHSNGLAFMHPTGDFDGDRSRFFSCLPDPIHNAAGAVVFDHCAAAPAVGAVDDHAEHAAKSLLRHPPLPAALNANRR